MIPGQATRSNPHLDATAANVDGETGGDMAGLTSQPGDGDGRFVGLDDPSVS